MSICAGRPFANVDLKSNSGGQHFIHNVILIFILIELTKQWPFWDQINNMNMYIHAYHHIMSKGVAGEGFGGSNLPRNFE